MLMLSDGLLPMLLKMEIDSAGTLRAVSREFVPTASRKRVAGEVFTAMSNSDPTLFERLAKVEPAKLARLLVELAAQDQTILEQVQFLLASGDTTAIAKAVRSTLRAWKRSPRFIHYQEAFAFGEQLDRLLDSVEDGLLGPDPALALDLLEEVLQRDHWILERVDDSAGCIGMAYRRACQLFARAAAG